MQKFNVREVSGDDVPAIANFVSRLKRLHGEFDPLLKTIEDLETISKEYVEKSLKDESSILLVATLGKRVVGMIKGTITDRLFFEPRIAGKLEEFYILPEYRRSGLGNLLLNEIVKRLKEKGGEITMAEAPSKNMIAASFYEKAGFRVIWNTYARAD